MGQFLIIGLKLAVLEGLLTALLEEKVTIHKLLESENNQRG